MRAKEFIIERKVGQLTKSQANSNKGLIKYTDDDRWDSGYKLLRLGMAMAGTDGISVPEMDEESWVGRFKTLHPYTQCDQDMIIMAAKAAGVKIHDVNHGDLKSKEAEDTYTVSPISNWNKK